MRLWHRSKTCRPSIATVAASWSALWQQVIRRFATSRPEYPRPLAGPRDGRVKKPVSPRARSTRRILQHNRPGAPVTARAYIDLLAPVLSDSERLEDANRVLSAPGTSLDLRSKAKRDVDLYARSLREQVVRILRTATTGQAKNPATVLSDITYERLRQLGNVLTAFLRSNVHDLDPYHESIIVHDRLQRASTRLTEHKLASTSALVNNLRNKAALLQQEQLKAAVYRVALATCRRHVEKAMKELVNIHAFNKTSHGTEPYGPFKPQPPGRLKDFDEYAELRDRWHQVRIDLATAEHALKNSEKRHDDWAREWAKAIEAGTHREDLAGIEDFNDQWLKKHRADHMQLLELKKTFKQVRDEAMAACIEPVTVVYRDPSAKKMKLKGPVEVDPDMDECLFHIMDGMTESEGSGIRKVQARYNEAMRPPRAAWVDSVVRDPDAVSSPPSQASIARRHVDVIRDHGAVWDCESVELGESRSHINHIGGDHFTILRRQKIRAYRDSCEALRLEPQYQGHYLS